MLEELTKWRANETSEQFLGRSPLLRSLWRGRMGMEEQQQVATHQAACTQCGKGAGACM